jgi:DNA-binding NarL/FixJ family response regulator
MRPKRILLADNHEIVRHGLRVVFESCTDFEIAAEAADGKQAIELILQEQPDVAIVEYSLPLIDGLEVTRHVKARKSNVELIIFTTHGSESLTEECFRCGARAVVLKSEPQQQLVSAAVEAAAARRPLAGKVAARKLLEPRTSHDGKCGKPSLTPRERTILKLVCEEHTNKEMSKLLGVSIKTVETHRASMIQKLAAKSIVDLVRYAIENRLIEP